MKGTIEVLKIKCPGYHGCLKEEAKVPREFEVDVWIECDMAKVVYTDELGAAVNYVDVISIVEAQMMIPSKMIEHTAGRIIETLKDDLSGIEGVTVRLTKLRPPINGNVASVSVIVRG